MYLLFDIGGTKTRIAVSRDGKTCSEPSFVHTPKAFDTAMALFRERGRAMLGGNVPTAVAAGVKYLDKKHDGMFDQHMLPDWAGKPLREKLQSTFGSPVYLQNDTALVGLGESVNGAGKGYSIVAYLTISTGVGGVRIVHGKIDDSAMGFEIGHMIINSKETEAVCPTCGALGDLESYISGTSFERRYDVKPYEIFDDQVWDDAAKILAVGLNNVIVSWSPDCIVIGGSMMNKIGISIDAIRKHTKSTVRIFPDIPEILHATLGDTGGIHGALEYVRTQEQST